MFLFALFLPPAQWGGSYVDFAYIVKPFWSCGWPLGLVTTWSGSSRKSNLLRSNPEPGQPSGWEYSLCCGDLNSPMLQARVNQHLQVHHARWMILCGHETLFQCISCQQLTTVVSQMSHPFTCICLHISRQVPLPTYLPTQ